MAVEDQLIEGLRLMAVGMGIVFTFLLLLVGVLRVMSVAVLRFAPKEAPAPAEPPTSAHGPGSDAAPVAAIAAAVARYRRDHPRP